MRYQDWNSYEYFQGKIPFCAISVGVFSPKEQYVVHFVHQIVYIISKFTKIF